MKTSIQPRLRTIDGLKNELTKLIEPLAPEEIERPGYFAEGWSIRLGSASNGTSVRSP